MVRTAVVVGSGPNGLAGAVRLAQSGVRVHVVEGAPEVGGGTRSFEGSVPGVLHDAGSAFHPLGVGSPYLSSLHLEEHGLRWRWPELDLAHPLDDGSAGVLSRDLDRTVAAMGSDGRAWRRVFGPLSRSFDVLAPEVLGPVLHRPAHPLVLAAFGAQALVPASVTVRQWRTPAVRALFGGLCAHAFGSLHAPLSSAVGLLLGAAGHRHGWPVAEGGSRSVSRALTGLLESLGGTVETGRTVADLSELAGADIVLLDTAPGAAARIAGDRLPRHVARAYRRYRHGPAAYKVDYSVRGDVPWTAAECRRAGTVHVGGTFEEIAATEGATVRGVLAARPFLLVGQQYLADPTRSAGGINPVWAYAHVPAGERGDLTDLVTRQIERFAPGFAARVVATDVRRAQDWAAFNPNYVGGDIGTGANTPRQLVLRPRAALDPYATGIRGVYLCSAATPPGAGVHGMAGFHAAESALRALGRPGR